MATYPQIIPRPENWQPGRNAPWASTDPLKKATISLADVRAVLEKNGLAGPPKENPSPHDEEVELLDGIDAKGELRASAVLIAFFEEEGNARVILTRRSRSLRKHRGEVSFPGGRIDPGETAEDAALRESFEEIGLAPSSVEIIGHLHPIVTLASTSFIQPVIGVLKERPSLRAAPDEVERVFDVALVELLAEGVFHEERWIRPERPSPQTSDGSFPLWFFEISNEMIWGATGRLLVDLLCAALDVSFSNEP